MILQEHIRPARRGSRTSWAGGPPSAGKGMVLRLQMPLGRTAEGGEAGATGARTDMRETTRSRKGCSGSPGPPIAMGRGCFWATGWRCMGVLGLAGPAEGLAHQPGKLHT